MASHHSSFIIHQSSIFNLWRSLVFSTCIFVRRTPAMQTPKGSAENSCWVTLLTKPSYLPGAIILAHTLDIHGSKYPLMIQYTSSLGREAISALTEEADNYGRIQLQQVGLLQPREDQENKGRVAERFKDTFTKLRAFQVYTLGYTRAVFLDADMAVFQNPDEIFDIELPGRDWLAANHSCACNLDHDPWAPADWQRGNCAYTLLNRPDEVAGRITTVSRPTYQLLNGGMFLFYPSEDLWNRMLHHFNTTETLKDHQFPDQDFWQSSIETSGVLCHGSSTL